MKTSDTAAVIQGDEQRVIPENFPELLNAIQNTNWPTVVKNERCHMPSTIGDDYQGATCMGVIATSRHNNGQVASYGAGKVHTGPECTPPAGNETTIALDLKPLDTGSGPAAENLSQDSGTR